MQSLQLLVDKQATKGGTAANEEPSSKDGKKIVTYLNTLAPADVKFGYDNDPETMGHRVRRGLHYDYDDSVDPGVIAFGSQVKTLRTAIVQKVMLGYVVSPGKAAIHELRDMVAQAHWKHGGKDCAGIERKASCANDGLR